MHQPPFKTGIGFMDNQPYTNREKFLNLLNIAGNVLLVGYGHIHRVMFLKNGNTNFSIAPSTAMQLDLNLSENAPGDFVIETSGYLIHRIGINKWFRPSRVRRKCDPHNDQDICVSAPGQSGEGPVVFQT